MSFFNWQKRKIKMSIVNETPAKELYESLIRNEIAPYLKTLHYYRNGHTFVKKRDDEVYTIINFQGSKWNDAKFEQEFYVNVAIISPSVYRAVWGEETTFKEEDGTLSARADFFVDNFPSSIKIRKGTDTEPIKDRILECLEYIEQNIFAQFNSLDDIRRYLADQLNIKYIGWAFQKPLYLGVMNALQGQPARAEEQFHSYIAEQMKRKDISSFAKRSIMRNCTLQAQAVGCLLHFPELDNESEIRVTFTTSRRTPIGDENKSIRRFENLLYKLGYDKELGYIEHYGSRARQGEMTFRFYTENPDETIKLLNRLAEKVPVKPAIYMAKG